MHALVGLVTGIADDMFNAGKSIISSLGDGFTAAFNGVWGIIKGFLNDIIGAIDLIPGVNIHKIGSSAPGTPAGAKAVGNLQAAGFATGGMVNRPGYFAGEEAPQHPEVILATNPAYRQRNVGLWAQAGNMLGIPGFALGGITKTVGNVLSGAESAVTGGVGALAGLLPNAPNLPKWISGLPGYLLSKAGAFIGSQVNATAAGGGASLPGDVTNWLMQAMAATGVSGPGWMAMLQRQVSRESGGNPNAINTTDINAQRGDPSRGLLQTIGSTFQQYALPGHGNIYNPVDNSIAAIRYMIATYGGGDPARALAVMAARGGGAYRKGGIHGGIPGYAQGGFVADPGTNFSVGVEPTIVQRLTALAQSIGATIYGISGYLTPLHSVAVGGFADDPHTRGQAADIGVNSQLRASAAQLSAAQLAKYGLDRPFDESGAAGNTEVNHIQLLPGWTAKKGSTIAAATKGIPQKAKKHGTTAGFSFPGGSGTMAGINFNSFKAGAVPAGTTPEIKALVGQINGVLDPNHGTIASLSDRISMTGQIDDQLVSEYQAANPYTDTSTGLIAFTDPVSGATTHTLDQTFVNMRIAELQQLLTWQTALRDQLKATLARITELVGRIQSAILTRRLYANKVRDQIRANIAQVNSLLVAEKAPHLTKKQKTALAGQVTALEAQNNTLGGEKLKVGSGGVLGKVTGEINSLGGTLSTMQDNRLAIIGASGIGGTLGAANLDVQSFADQLSVFSPAATAKALASAAAADAAANAGGTGVAAPAGPDPALLQQLLDQAHLATSVAEHQLSVLSATPPFGGSFAQGGIVPGMPGEPRTIIAHGGEAVGTPGDTHVHVHLASGMEWLRQFIGVQVDQSTRRDARNASRPLPGRASRY